MGICWAKPAYRALPLDPTMDIGWMNPPSTTLDAARDYAGLQMFADQPWRAGVVAGFRRRCAMQPVSQRDNGSAIAGIGGAQLGSHGIHLAAGPQPSRFITRMFDRRLC